MHNWNLNSDVKNGEKLREKNTQSLKLLLCLAVNFFHMNNSYNILTHTYDGIKIMYFFDFLKTLVGKVKVLLSIWVKGWFFSFKI